MHIALILDGNRTWAKKRGLPKMVGHTKGAQNVKRVVLAAIEQNVDYVTMYALSTENLKNRSEKELAHLFSLFAKIVDYQSLFDEHNVKFQTIGDLTALPQNLQDAVNDLIDHTKNYDGLTLTFAINYGGRDEIVRAIKRLHTKDTDFSNLTEEQLTAHLDTADMPDVDLMIRPGGFQRLSNYLPWQTTYAELYFLDKKWPEFSGEDLAEAIEWYELQEKKKGR